MSRARWAAWGLAAGLGLACGCSTLSNHPLFHPCSGGTCSAGACCPGVGPCECEGYGLGGAVTGGPVLGDYVVPGPVGAPGVPAAPAVPGVPVVPGPGAAPLAPTPPLEPQVTVPPLASPDRLVPQPQSPPMSYRRGGV
jgi:hypothetical protein